MRLERIPGFQIVGCITKVTPIRHIQERILKQVPEHAMRNTLHIGPDVHKRQ